ncbi:receptor-like serine/threonine-protein kinase ale2 [Phtheirospermum japonicum]|uniref:non-specific serine/threonine protein kinase n=1 Tax=Phtheirospermum japonicum TaxID=374723 RepID=A0A830BCN6_9LAMI|nr:receptor-like serine/threonine-protein kinase ale2 [Phtheirospermum japonicum]
MRTVCLCGEVIGSLSRREKLHRNPRLLRRVFSCAVVITASISFTGTPSQAIHLSPSQLPLQSFGRKNSLEHVNAASISELFSPFLVARRHRNKYLSTAPAPAPTPVSQGPLTSRTRKHRHHRHKARAHVVSPSPSTNPALYAIFPEVTELEIEVAAGTYLKQSQVAIIGASADALNQERTVVDINLVPLGEKFDDTTAILTFQRFLHKKVPLNRTLFGDYGVMNISYPGLPSSPPSGILFGEGPTGSAGNQQYPITADFVGKNQKINPRIIIVIALSAFVLLVVACAVVAILVKCRTASRPSNVVELENATEKFSSKKVLGEGGFGRVYLGVLHDGTEVAVKLLLTRDNNQNGDREFIAEIEMLSRLHHRNLVKLIGICIEQRTRCLVYELVPNGSVESHLHGDDKSEGPLDWDARLKIALGAARGLAYLHEDSNPRVIHRDFKASNVLLEDDFTPKVSDFGHLLVKSDVYSYGVVLLELLSGRKPVDMSQSPGQENLVTWARPLLTNREGLEHLVDPSLAGTYNFDDMAKVAAIASMCVHPEVTHRPFMGEVVQALKLIYNDTDETCADAFSLKESSARDSDFKGDFAHSDGSWWNAGCVTPRLTYGQASSFITMEYSSGPLEEMENRPFSASCLGEGGVALPIRHGNRSGPLRTVRSKRAFYRLQGSVSEHGDIFTRRAWNDGTDYEASF